MREQSLYGIEYDGERRLPRFQLERGHVLPGLREVLAVLPGALNPLDVAEWFLSPNPHLELGEKVMSPREWRLRGEPVATVVALARVYYTSSTHPLAWNQFRHFGPLNFRWDHHAASAAGEPQEQSRSVYTAAMDARTCLAEVFQATRRRPWDMRCVRYSVVQGFDGSG